MIKMIYKVNMCINIVDLHTNKCISSFNHLNKLTWSTTNARPAIIYCPIKITNYSLMCQKQRMTFGLWFNMKMSSYWTRKSRWGDQIVVRSSYFHNGIFYASKTSFLYWIGARVLRIATYIFQEFWCELSVVSMHVTRFTINPDERFVAGKSSNKCTSQVTLNSWSDVRSCDVSPYQRKRIRTHWWLKVQ